MAGGGPSILAVAAAVELSLIDGRAPKRVKLLPMGQIDMRDGRGPYRLADRSHADRVVAATRTWLGSADFNFDYDHQTLHAQRVGGRAIAAGWIKPATLSVEEDGIYGEVEWTAAAAAAIEAKEYRYVSPTFFAAKADGSVLRLKNAALVNIGAIDLPAIAAGLSEEDDNMDLAALAALVGLAADSSVEQIAAAIGELKKTVPSTGAIAVAAGLADSATVDEIAAAVTTLKTAAPDPAKYVPIEQVTGITQQLGVLTGERAEREVAAAVSSGKLAPSMKAWGLNLFKTNEPAWNDYLKDAPVIVAAGAELGDRKTAQNFTSLTADEIAACEMTGMSHEDFLKAKNAPTVELV